MPMNLNAAKRFVRKLFRLHKIKDDKDAEEEDADGRTKLNKCLSTLDLISLGAGSCVGTGMFVVSGMVARDIAGPGVIISFVIAATASILSGACYAEFGVRVPNTSGSAYMYSYVTVGEFIAFFIGWNMILEYLIGTSACAAALSLCFDSLSNHAITTSLSDSFGKISGGSPPDVIAFVICLFMTAVLAAGVKKSVLLNNVLNAVNIAIFVFIIGAGLFYVDFQKNWIEVGFMPYGWSGVFSGAATCFYAFVGFDIIATTGEEANDPTKSIPIAIILSMVIALFAYVMSSAILTAIVPYYEISIEAPLQDMFAQNGAYTAKYIVAIGAIAALTVSMFGSMFPMPRVVYAMAKDGVLFRELAKVPAITKTPLLATVTFGVLTAVAALLIPLESLVEMMSVGTLLAYTLVSTCVLIMRYQPKRGRIVLLPSMSIDSRRLTLSRSDTDATEDGLESPCVSVSNDDAFLVPDGQPKQQYGSLAPGGDANAGRLGTLKKKLRIFYYRCYAWKVQGEASKETGKTVTLLVCSLIGFIVLFNVIIVAGLQGQAGLHPALVVLTVLLVLAIVGCLLQISRYPQNKRKLKFTTPGLPLLPAAAILVNTYLLFKLSLLTLVRVTVWMVIGFPIYFLYGIKNSTLALKEKEREELALATINELPDRNGAPRAPSGFQGAFGEAAVNETNLDQRTGFDNEVDKDIIMRD